MSFGSRMGQRAEYGGVRLFRTQLSGGRNLITKGGNKMKKYIALLMALVMGLSVAGCGQSASSSASSEAASSSADSNEE